MKIKKKLGSGKDEEKQIACAMWVKLTPLFPGSLNPCCLWQHSQHIERWAMGNNPNRDGDRFKAGNQVLLASDFTKHSIF